MNQLPLQRRIVRQTLPNLMLFAAPKPNLPDQTDSNAALLPYLTHQLGSAHEWSGVWNGPYSRVLKISTKTKRHASQETHNIAILHPVKLIINIFFDRLYFSVDIL